MEAQHIQCLPETSLTQHKFQVNVGANFIIVIVIAAVPAQVPILNAYSTQKNSVLLEWGLPPQTNGILIGYLLQYHLSTYSPSKHSLHIYLWMLHNLHSS